MAIKCDCGSENIVYSGIDAFLLGVPTEKVCYECANAKRSN